MNISRYPIFYIFGVIDVLFMFCGFFGFEGSIFFDLIFLFATSLFGLFYFTNKDKDFNKWSFILDIVLFLIMIPISITVIKMMIDNARACVITSLFYIFYISGFIYKKASDLKQLKISKSLLQENKKRRLDTF